MWNGIGPPRVRRRNFQVVGSTNQNGEMEGLRLLESFRTVALQIHFVRVIASLESSFSPSCGIKVLVRNMTYDRLSTTPKFSSVGSINQNGEGPRLLESFRTVALQIILCNRLFFSSIMWYQGTVIAYDHLSTTPKFSSGRLDQSEWRNGGLRPESLRLAVLHLQNTSSIVLCLL
jgi:hypothetical protein